MAMIEVILTEDMGKLGEAGEVVKVRAGYGRNYLLPQGKAMLATVARVNEIEHQKRVIEEKQRKSIGGFQEIARRAAAVELAFEAQASPEGKLFGSVTNADIQARLAENGVEVERRKIELSDPIKSLGEHEARLRLHREVIVPLKISVVASGVISEPEDDLTAGMDDGSREGRDHEDQRRGERDDDDDDRGERKEDSPEDSEA